MFKGIKNWLFYANMPKEDIEDVYDLLHHRNAVALSLSSVLCLLGFSAMFFSSYVLQFPGMVPMAPALFVAAVCSALIFAFSRLLVPRFPKSSSPLCQLLLMVMLVCGLVISFFLTPDQRSISYVVFVTIVPFFFIDKPYRILSLVVLFNLVFTYLSIGTDLKPEEYCEAEVAIVWTFSLVGIALGYYNIRTNISRYVFEKRVQRLIGQGRQAKYWRSISSIYVSMHWVDLDSFTFVPIQSNDYIDNVLDKKNEHFDVQVKQVMRATTDPGYLEDMLKFVDVTTLVERMAGKKTITHEFLGKNFGWCRARFVAVDNEDDADHHLRYVMFLVENINEQVSREKKLTTMAETDELTGLLNRRAGFAKITEKLQANKPGMLCLFDVDDFKSVNDGYGHQAGDEVLGTIAETMKHSFRDEDVLLRLGGDEYMAFVSGVKNETLGSMILQRFMNALAEKKLKTIPDYSISISLGAVFCDGQSDLKTLYKAADECTYESKKIPGCSFTFAKNLKR